MGTFTNFIKLHKPEENEKYTVNIFNANAELIDSALARMEQENENRDNLLDTLNTKATDLADGFLSKEDHAKYEDANTKKHTHNNKTVLDGITAALISAWNTVTNKVDKVAGKGLSTHDYTTEEKDKLNGIESGAKANVQADWNVSDTDSDAYIKNKPDFTAKDLGNISSVRQSGYTAISAETWSKILSITLSAGTYIIVGQLNVYGKQVTSKYIAITDSNLSAYNAADFILTQVYCTVTTILEIANTQEICLAAYSAGEAATTTNGVLTALKIK